MFGLTKGKVEVVSYSKTWPDLFIEEQNRLINILGKHNFIDILHIGRTSIPNLEAKPIIDIAIAVESFEEAQKLVQPMINAGYDYKGEYGIPRRHYFVKYKDNESLFHVHMNEITSKEWNDQIYFRNYITTHQEMRQKYGLLKTQLAKEFLNDRDSYTDGKHNFVQSILNTKNSKTNQ